MVQQKITLCFIGIKIYAMKHRKGYKDFQGKIVHDRYINI